MKPFRRYARRLFAPLVYLAAICLLIEEWLWATGARIMQVVAQFPPLHALEAWIKRLPPYWALAIFVLPAVLLFPVKLLALLAIARGDVPVRHWASLGRLFFAVGADAVPDRRRIAGGASGGPGHPGKAESRAGDPCGDEEAAPRQRGGVAAGPSHGSALLPFAPRPP